MKVPALLLRPLLRLPQQPLLHRQHQLVLLQTRSMNNEKSITHYWGEWKRRVLPFASIEGLRPTPDRVRETFI